jgi:hypothetical protein
LQYAAILDEATLAQFTSINARFGGKADIGRASCALGCNERSARNHDDHREDFNQKLVVHWRTFGTSSAQKQRFLAR